MNDKFEQFRQFSLLHLSSRDIDPVYFVLKEFYRIKGWDNEQQVWFTILYNLLYNIQSAWKLFQLYPARQEMRLEKIRDTYGFLPTGTERRGFRGNYKYIQTVTALPRHHLFEYYRGMVNADPVASWEILQHDWDDMPHNGTWARYKWCDLLKNIHDFPISAPDIGFGGGSKASSPVAGLSQLTGLDWKQCAYDKELQQSFYQKCLAAGIPLNGLEEMETCLCDFNTYTKGKYYIGHDIDGMFETCREMPSEFWQARANVFPKEYLREAGNTHLKRVQDDYKIKHGI